MGGEAKGDAGEGGGHQRHAGRGVGKMGVEVLDAGAAQAPGGKGGHHKVRQTAAAGPTGLVGGKDVSVKAVEIAAGEPQDKNQVGQPEQGVSGLNEDLHLPGQIRSLRMAYLGLRGVKAEDFDAEPQAPQRHDFPHHKGLGNHRENPAEIRQGIGAAITRGARTPLIRGGAAMGAASGRIGGIRRNIGHYFSSSAFRVKKIKNFSGNLHG